MQRSRSAAVGALLAGLCSATGAAAQTTGAPVSIKPPLIGLLQMGQGGTSQENDNAQYGIYGNKLNDVEAKRNAFGGVVINIPWVEIQPNGPSDFQTDAIDQALANIRQYNSDPRTTVPLQALLRIWAGANAPPWAKALDGGPITLYYLTAAQRGQAYMAGLFWAPGYRNAWRDLHALLAGRYDGEPLIVQVSNASCTSDDDEPFALSRYFDEAKGISSIHDLHAAGFDDDAYEDCLSQSADDYAAWRSTPVNFDFGAIFLSDHTGDYQYPTKDLAFTINLIKQWRSGLGARGVLSNHTLTYPLNSEQVPMYQTIQALGPPTEFQTHSPAGLNWPATVKEAVCLKATSLEVWNSTAAGGFVNFPTSTLAGWSSELKMGPPNNLCPHE